MPNYEKLNKEIREMIKNKLNIRVDIEEIEDDMLFGTSYGFDSTTLLEFILQLEDHYNLIIPDEDLNLENFGTIDGIVNYVANTWRG